MAEARAIKFCTKEDYIKPCQKDDKSPLKGAWICSRDPFFVCTTVELETRIPSGIWSRLLGNVRAVKIPEISAIENLCSPKKWAKVHQNCLRPATP